MFKNVSFSSYAVSIIRKSNSCKNINLILLHAQKLLRLG